MVKFRGHAEERDYHEMDWTLLRRIWPFVRPYKWSFAICLLSLLVSFGLVDLFYSQRHKYIQQEINKRIVSIELSISKCLNQQKGMFFEN